MRFIELFAGIGGFRYGLEEANRIRGDRSPRPKHRRGKEGLSSQEEKPSTKESSNPDFRCVWANELNKYACQIYRKHYGEICEQDIRTVDPSTIPEHDLITAGFPCQSFSIAGKRGGFEDTRGTLFFEICRIARAKRTPYLLLENVKGLLSHDNGDTFQTIIRTLDELGYDCQWQVLNSKDFGVPQNRERVFIIGHLRGQPRPKVFPIGEATEFDTYQDKELPEHLGNTLRTNYSSGFSNETYILGREVSYAIDGNYYKGTNTLEDGRRQMVAQDMRIRRLTPIECERLQGFPDNWTKGISDTQRYKCLGNAVTTNVIEAIGRQWNE